MGWWFKNFLIAYNVLLKYTNFFCADFLKLIIIFNSRTDAHVENHSNETDAHVENHSNKTDSNDFLS